MSLSNSDYLVIVNIIITSISPIIISLGYCIRKISKSKCTTCAGGSMEIDSDNSPNTNKKPNFQSEIHHTTV